MKRVGDTGSMAETCTALEGFMIKLIVVFFILTLCSCSAFSGSLFSREGPEDMIKPSPSVAQSKSSVAELNNYRIGPNDILAISILELNDKMIESRVSNEGFIDVAYVGSVQVLSKTTTEVEKAIREKLIEKGILVNPNVSVQVKEFFSKQVVVLGQVLKPGTITITGRDITIVEAIGYAGGFTRIAAPSRVKVIHANGKTKVSQTIDVDDILSGKNPSKNIILQPNDVVYVPESYF